MIEYEQVIRNSCINGGIMKEKVVYYKGKREEELPTKEEMAIKFNLNIDEFDYLYDVFSKENNAERVSFNNIVKAIENQEIKELYIKNPRHIYREFIEFLDFCNFAKKNNCLVKDGFNLLNDKQISELSDRLKNIMKKWKIKETKEKSEYARRYCVCDGKSKKRFYVRSEKEAEEKMKSIKENHKLMKELS